MLTIILYKYYNQPWSLKSLQNLIINPKFSAWKTIMHSTFTLRISSESSYFILLALQVFKLLIYFIREISNLLWEAFILHISWRIVNVHKYLNAFYWIILFSYVTIFTHQPVLIVNLLKHYNVSDSALYYQNSKNNI